MRKTEEVRKKIEEIRKDFEEKAFKKVYSYIEAIIDQESSIGWIYTYKKIPIDSTSIIDKIFCLVQEFEDLPEFDGSYFLELNDDGNWKQECFDKEIEHCLEKVNKKLEQDGWKVHFLTKWKVNSNEEYDGYISFFE